MSIPVAAGADSGDDPHAWACELKTLHEHAWQRLIRGVHDRHAPARHPTLATVSLDGLPQARTVVLRAADRATQWLEVHTNLLSSKVEELRTTPAAAVHIWDRGSSLQIRLRVDATIITGAQTADAWSAVPERSRSAYGSDHRPGQPIASALAYAQAPDPDAFAVLHLAIRSMDLLHLGIPHHRRAEFSRHDDWAGPWLVP